MSWDGEKLPAIARVEGAPRLPHAEGETTTWQAFKSWFWRKLGWADESSEAYAEARVARERSEAARIASEAAEIAARAEETKAQAGLTRQHLAKQFSENLDAIFADDGLSQTAKVLKLAKVMADDPTLLDRAADIQRRMEELRIQRGVRIAILGVESATPAEEEHRARATSVARDASYSAEVVVADSASVPQKLEGEQPSPS